MAQKKLLGNLAKVPSNTIKILLVVIGIALIFSTKVVAEFIAGQKIISVPVTDFQNTSMDIFYFALGAIVLIFSGLILLPVFKTIMFLSGIALMIYAGRRLYNLFFLKK